MADNGGDLGDRSVADLLKQASDQTATLVHQELELAKAELTTKGKQVGLGAGMFGGAGVFGVYAFGALTAAVIFALEHVSSRRFTPLAALIVGSSRDSASTRWLPSSQRLRISRRPSGTIDARYCRA